MPRDIKFRAWDKDFKKLVPWEKVIRWPMASFIHQDIILEQFTGLRDNNGREIFEGDIVQDDGGTGEIKYRSNVVFHKDRFCGDLTPYGEGRHITISEHAEVLGNIHENPELLK